MSESGVPLAGRNATPEEVKLLGNRRYAVVRAYPETIGRNGRRFFTSVKGTWDFSSRGRQWADLLLY